VRVWRNWDISLTSAGKSFLSILLTTIKYVGSWKEKEMRRKMRKIWGRR